MNARVLLIVALVVSVALNVFGAAVGVTAWLNRSAAEAEAEQARQPRDRMGPMDAIGQLDPATAENVRAGLREAALAARDDFHDARNARREAIALVRNGGFDEAEISVLLERSRASELRGRATLEDGAVRILAGLEPDDRAAMSVILMRHGPRHRGGPRDRPEAPAE